MSKTKIKAWGHSLRLRTIPLSISGTIVAGGLAMSHGCFRTDVFVLMLCTAALLQILSNMANDYGDFCKGTDNENRIGPSRALQSGDISPRSFLIGTLAVCFMTMVCGLALVLTSFGVGVIYAVLLFLALGASCIWAAIQYTVGKRAYGYKGLGDLFVFLFFGIVPVTGGLFLYTHTMEWYSLLPASAIGLMSAGVLNLNNMRDVENDRVMGKRTLASHMTIGQGKAYQSALILTAMVCFILYQYMETHEVNGVVIAAVCVLNVWLTVRVKERKEFDKYLKVLSLSTFLLSVVFSVALNV